MNSDTSVRLLTRRKLLAGAGATVISGLATTAARARTTRRFDVQRFVEDCKRANEITADAQEAVKEVLIREMSDTNAVLTGVGAPQKGGIQTLYRSTTLTVLNIVWAPLMQLMPHEHRMWALIGIYSGREDNIFWRRHAGSVSAVGAASISQGDVVPLAQDVIHSVVNPIEKLTGAIHIYGGDFFEMHRSEWDPENLSERDWDVKSAIRLFEQSNDRFFGWKGNQ